VLDAGCGVGGTSLFLAQEYGFEVVGITLSSTQLRRAQRLADLNPASHRPTFLEADYLCTGLPDASFDGVFGLESVCYAEPKRAFMREAFRLLRPGGRLAVLDGFLGKRTLSAREARDYRRFMHGVALSSLAHPEDFAADLRSVGFEDVSWTDRSRYVMPSALMIEVMTSVGVVLGSLLFKLGLLPPLWLDHGRAGMSQRRLFQSGAMVYGTFATTKPHRSS
jgi:SAM-dependent methyltransferase